MNMWTPFLLIALAATPWAQQQKPVSQQVEELSDLLAAAARLTRARDLALRAEVDTLVNTTSQILEELDVVRSRQAASAAVLASQVIMMVTYFLTILSVYIVKRCQKVSEKAKRKEFERLEMQLRSSKAKRRAAAAKEKSAPAQSLE